MAPATSGPEAPSLGSAFSIRSLLSARDDKGCEDGTKSANLCEKPVGNSNVIPIVVGVIVPLVVAVALVYYFHRKGMKRRAREEAADPNQDLDFGLDGNGGGAKRKSMFREKMLNIDPRHRAQVSMDMNLQSPYLLPPALQGSKESLHSLARNINGNEDPYRPIQHYGSEVGSIRSFRHDKETMGGSSIYTKSTERRDTATSRDLPPRGNSLSHRHNPPSPIEHLPMPPPPVADPFGTPRSGSMTPRSDMDMASPVSPRAIVPEIGTVQFPQANYNELDRDDVTSRDQNAPAQGTARSSWGEPGMAVSDRSLPGQAQTTDVRHESLALPELGVGLGLDDMHFQEPPSNAKAQSVPTLGLPSSPRPPPQTQNSPLPTIISEDTHTHDAHDAMYHEDVYEERGRPAQRRSMEGNYRDSQVLGVPQQDNKRLSVGQRPLPPDEFMEFEDPEERANRIRSFYKEYFDDSVRPDQQQRGPPQGGGVPYYEDYDPGYAGNNNHNGNHNEGAYYDPKSNAFVMPYAQPVTRRAMTPPPGQSRQRFPPQNRPRNGSMGGMSMPGGRRPPPPRTGSAMSSNWGHPRPGSSVSNRSARQPKPRGPPPPALTTLPTPSKLKDDSIAIFGAIDFAPPDSYEDRNRGRSQSPVGERRPYKPKVPVASPLISSYDEMGAIPSPHLLRKSSTFTGLDFAPPRRFGNGDDNMSDAGSIRSNRSGISAAQAHAIRSGAGRVSRLPEDTVFTTAKLEQTLKPSWSMRDL